MMVAAATIDVYSWGCFVWSFDV